MKKYDFIVYKTTELSTGMIYVGYDSYNRPMYYGSGKYFLNKMYKVIKEYIENNLHEEFNPGKTFSTFYKKYEKIIPLFFKKEILMHYDIMQDMILDEPNWIKKFNATNRNVGYNIIDTQTWGDTWTNLSKDDKDKRKLRYKKTIGNAEYKENISKMMKECWSKVEYREKQRLSHQTQEYLSKVTGKNNSSCRPEVKEKISKSLSRPEVKEKISMNLKKYWNNSENKAKHSLLLKEIFKDPKIRENISTIVKNSWTNPDIRERQIQGMRNAWSMPDIKERHSNMIKECWTNPTFRNNKINGIKEYWSNPNNIDKQCKIMKEIANRPDVKEKKRAFIKEFMNRPENKEKQCKKICKFSKENILIEEFNSIKEAAEKTGIRNTNIITVCKGREKTAGGFIWRYKEEIDEK